MDASGAIELLKQIISIPSFSKEEDKVADLIADVLKRYRFDVHRKGNNVWSRSKNFDDAKPTLLPLRCTSNLYILNTSAIKSATLSSCLLKEGMDIICFKSSIAPLASIVFPILS